MAVSLAARNTADLPLLSFQVATVSTIVAWSGFACSSFVVARRRRSVMDCSVCNAVTTCPTRGMLLAPEPKNFDRLTYVVQRGAQRDDDF